MHVQMKYSETPEPILARTPALASLSRASRLLLRDALQPVSLAADEVLFRRGAAGDGCYLVEEGALNVSIDDHTGGTIWLAVLGAGDWVGELGVIDRSPRSATVTAMTDCRLWWLPMRTFDRLWGDDPEFYHCMVRIVCSRLRATNRQVCDQRLGLQARLAQTLVTLAKVFGEELPDGRTIIRYQIDQSRLAEIAGASRENVNRQFRTWREAGLCERVRGNYCLSDLRAWEGLAEEYLPANTG